MPYSKLRGRIKEYFGTETNFAKAINLSRTSISLRLNKKIDWKQTEIKKACSLLHIESVNINAFFFE